MGWLYLSGKGSIYMGKGKRSNMDGETGMLRINSALITEKTNRNNYSLKNIIFEGHRPSRQGQRVILMKRGGSGCHC